MKPQGMIRMVLIAILLMTVGCNEQVMSERKEPELPELTPGEKAAIEFYKAMYVEGNEKKVQKLYGDEPGFVEKNSNEPIDIQPMKGSTLTETQGTYYIRKPDQTYMKVEVVKQEEKNEWSVSDYDSINQLEINNYADEDSWKKVKRP